jgi:hypothetical protein
MHVERGQFLQTRFNSISFVNLISAKNFASAVREADDVPVDVGDEIEMNLPDFADDERIKS